MTINSIAKDRKRLGPLTDQIRRMMSEFDVISFDVFETLLFRRGVYRPMDVFFEVGGSCRSLTKIPPDDFAKLRVRAERDARCRAHGQGKEEVTLEAIYECFSKLTTTLGYQPVAPGLLAKLAEIEIEVELRHLEPIESVKELFDWAAQQGKRILLISDFYAPSSMLRTALSEAGYDAAYTLFVSGELDKTKHHGSLYEHVLDECKIKRETVLHIGDNVWSDGARAHQSDIAHLRILNPAQELAGHLRHWTTQPLPRLTSVALARIGDDGFGIGLDNFKPHQIDLAERTGRMVLGPLLLGMASWLYAQAKQHKFSKMFFCARDGLIMKHAFDAFQRRFPKCIETAYLGVSRQVIYRAQGAADPDSVREIFMQNWDKLSPADALSRWGLDPKEFAKQFAQAGIDRPDLPLAIGDAAGRKKLARLFEICKGTLPQANARHSQLLLGYLGQQGMLQAKAPCLVDIGWHGSLQKGLQALLTSTGHDVRLSGRYLGLFPPVSEMRKLRADGYLFSTDDTPIAKALRASPSLVELLHTAYHGSVQGYAEDEEGTIRLVYESRRDELAQFEAIIAPIQAAALQFIADVLTQEHLTPDVLAPSDAFAGLNRLLNRPSPDEIDVLGGLRISANYGSNSQSVALTEKSPAGYQLWKPHG